MTEPLQVIELDAAPDMVVLAVDEGPEISPVFIRATDTGAHILDDLLDVDGAAAGTTGQVLTRQVDGQYRPRPVPATRLIAVAATVLSGHRVVTPLLDGTVSYADNTNPAHLNAPLWITTGAALAGTAVEVHAAGLLIESSWSWAPGPLFLGGAGAITQVPPAAPAVFLAQLGAAIGATAVFIDRHPSIALS